MSVGIEKEEYMDLPDLPYDEGRHSKFKLYHYNNEPHLIKEFVRKDGLKEAKEQVRRLVQAPQVKNTAYPIDTVKVSGKIIGYICTWYYQAYSHSYVLSTNIPNFNQEQKEKAVLDTTKQLKEFHQNGFILSDVRLANHLIDKNGGHLIDFEDTLVAGCEKVTPAPFYFFHLENGLLVKNPSSQEEDRRKQALTHISFLLNVNLEYVMHQLQQQSFHLIDCFRKEPMMQEIMKDLFYEKNIPYFTDYLPIFHDADKNKTYGKKLDRQIQKELLREYY